MTTAKVARMRIRYRRGPLPDIARYQQTEKATELAVSVWTAAIRRWEDKQREEAKHEDAQAQGL
jgi:hypothetical protein